VNGIAAISLRANGDDTVVDVHGTVQAAGAVARVGQRLLGSVSQMMMDRFFGCLQGKLGSAGSA
jgi:carbon monoxide dehydrogenase subunit G